MNNRIFRSITESIRVKPSYDESWNGDDIGLITCWEVGRGKRKTEKELVKKIENNELPVLGWKGGVDKELKKKEKFGSLNYLAQWQGLKNQDLDISLSQEITMQCSKTGMMITYTPDSTKYSQP
jgi:Zn ribbon nucleic-acid-binding protein